MYTQQAQGNDQIGRPALEVAAESLQEILDWQTAIEEVRNERGEGRRREGREGEEVGEVRQRDD